MVRREGFLVAAMVALAIGALIPPFLYQDEGATLPPIALMQLKAEASRGYPVPPGVMQVLDVRARGEYPYQAEGTIVYRSLFGLTVASARSYNSATVYDLAAGRLWAVWAGFLLAGGVLGILLYRWQ